MKEVNKVGMKIRSSKCGILHGSIRQHGGEVRGIQMRLGIYLLIDSVNRDARRQ